MLVPMTLPRPLCGHRLALLVAALGTTIASAAGGMASHAAPGPDLRPYPPAAPGERRWFISVAAPSSEGDAPRPDQRVELIVGRTMLVDCNRHLLQGSLEEESVPGWGYPIFRVKGGQQLVSTRMACPGQPPRRQFVALGGSPPLVPVNPRLPIVVYAPRELEVRWRLWRADPIQRPGNSF